MILKRSVSSILTFLQEFEKELALEFGCDRPGTNRWRSSLKILKLTA